MVEADESERVREKAIDMTTLSYCNSKLTTVGVATCAGSYKLTFYKQEMSTGTGYGRSMAYYMGEGHIIIVRSQGVACSSFSDQTTRPSRKLEMSSQKFPSTIHCEVVQALDSLHPLNIFVMCMDRSDLQHNIIDNRFGLDLIQAVLLAEKKALCGEVDIVVLCSAKTDSFMAGADILHELKFIGIEGAYR